jgi:chromosome segregation ATPase
VTVTSALAILLAGTLLSGCETDRDPRAGGFIEGVTNLSNGGYESYVGERRVQLQKSESQAEILQARAQSITAEKETLDRELAAASDELTSLQIRLMALQDDLDWKSRRSAQERQKLDAANKKATEARAKVDALKTKAPGSVDAQRESIADLKSLIDSVAGMVSDLSGAR